MKGFFNIRADIFFLALFAGVIAACTGPDEKKPANLLSHEQVAAVLVETYITEEKVSRLRLKQDSATRVMDYFAPEIVKRAGIADSLWEPSFRWYASRPEELAAIYAIVIDSLQLREQRVDIVTPKQ